ncbi:MAG: YchJ family metal-binding protein [Ornithinibacter sp.]
MAGDVDDNECGDAPCPCGGVPPGATLDACCGPLVRGEALAATAEQLMRSRYTAYAVAAGDHLFRTWHARTRPTDVEPDPWVRWEGLELLDVVDGGEDDATGVVEYRARWITGEGATHQRGELHERSSFVRRAGRWMYVDGE